MSEGDVSLIQDEDVLRRMWQQTEDFSRKKEIRTHMYRLREERLRNLYSPESLTADAKGCEFTSAQGHGTSFADQTFQSMKSKEVRDAGSPPKEFTYRPQAQDLKEYSNAGWNVESEDKTTDGGATRVKAVHASIEGRYDVDGGVGQFAAADSQRRARTVQADDNSSTVRDESSASSASRDHVVRQTPDGTHISKTASSSTTSNYKQVSSTKHETVPYVTEPEYESSRQTSRQTSRDTNTDERVTRITNRSDYDQSLRTDNRHGDLVSRKVEYPDENTKVIVETRSLPDGTRVTSTRREFRVPAQQTRSEANHSRNESKSYSSQQKSDTRESTSKTTRHVIDNSTSDIVDSQRNVDDYDFRRQIREYVTDHDDRSDVRRHDISRNDRHETRTERNVSDIQKEDYLQTHSEKTVDKKVIDHSTIKRDEYTQVHRDTNQRYVDNVDETDRRQENIITTRDDRTPRTDEKVIHHAKDTEERIHNITRDKRLEEIVERKTSSDQYQTTYQSDYQQKKVSNDWSPSQQAWASSLRADTPSTTRPSTRASSPGSRTFKSSTSSLRSSVSPDKYRKPSSRGGSPNKIDRYSPTRTITSDLYSSTQNSTQSITETRTNKYTSPERKPPSGRSPTRHAYSPERTPQDRQKFSTSPEKRPQSSPTRASPGKSPVSPTRPHQNPERHTPSQYHRNTSPSRPATTPEREVGYRQSPQREVPFSPKRSSASPDRKPGYMRPTAASQHTPDARRPSRPEDEPHRKSPSKQPSLSPDRKTYKSRVTEDNYEFVDEETKVHVRNQKSATNTKTVSPNDSQSPRYMSPSPKTQTPKDTDLSPKPRGKSPSPQRDTITITENDELYGRIDKTVEIINTDTNKQTDDTKTTKISKGSIAEKTGPKDDSPSKFDTYNKKKTREFLSTDETTSITSDESVKIPKMVPEPSSPTKMPTRDSTSPYKSTTKDTKFKHTTDFISTERNTEEINKKTVSKDRTRQLTTPSSSPTRKLKPTEPEPSTGQSSPTTSVSGFVYFGSPPRDQPMVTDLDDNEPQNIEQQIYDRPESLAISVDSLDLRRSTSPSKIPCRSPSPEKRTSPVKETLPRKSSLKKPSAPPADVNLPSPVEKPPTSFQVSPSEDKPDVFPHKIVKKEQPEGDPTDSPIKPKPPLQRRETYEERCRKILGMADDNTTETVTKVKRTPKRQDSVHSSPSVSPCDSPAPKETPFPELTELQTTITKVVDTADVTDFIAREIGETVKTTNSQDKPKAPSRESSPTKLQDIISKTTSVLKNETESIDKETTNKKTVIKQDTYDIPRRSSKSPEKQVQEPIPAPRSTSPTKPTPRSSISPSKKPRDSPTKQVPGDDTYPKETSPTRRSSQKSIYSTTTVTSDMSQDIQDISMTKTRQRVLKSPVREIPDKTKPRDSPGRYGSPDDTTDEPKQRQSSERPPSRPRDSPEKIYTKTTKVTSEFDTSVTQQNKVSKVTGKKDTTATSPTRYANQPRTTSPSKPSSESRKPELSPERKTSRQSTEPTKREPKATSPTRPNDLPGYMRTTTSTTKRDSITTENIQDTTIIKKSEKRFTPSSPSVSPTRRADEKPRTPSPTKTTRPNEYPKKFEKSPEKKPHQPSSPTEKSVPKSPTQSSPHKVPGYMKSTATSSFKTETLRHDIDVTETQENFTSVIDREQNTRYTKSPTRSSPDRVIPHHREPSPSKPTDRGDSPNKNRDVSPTSRPKDSRPSYMRPTESITNKFESTVVETEDILTSKSVRHQSPLPTSHSPTRRSSSPEKKDRKSLFKDDLDTPADSHPKTRDTPRSSISPDTKPSYMKPTASVIHKYESTTTDEQSHDIKSSQITNQETRQLRTPSPTKKPTKVVDVNSEFILSEKEKEILDKVQKSLRKLSPDRKEKSPSPPSRERSPNKSTTSLQDLDIVTSETVEKIHKFTGDDLYKVTEEKVTIKTDVKQSDKPKEQKTLNKPNSRNVSPIKKTPVTPAKSEKISETPNKSRSISPKKSVSSERPHSPQVSRVSGIKPREPMHSLLTRKPTPATLKIDKIPLEIKKTNNGASKQTITVKTSTSKISRPISSPTKTIEPDSKRTPTAKVMKELVSPKKETVSRTTSDISIKPKKTLPQRMRSKPEIQINDMSSKSPKTQKPVKDTHSKLPTKPKSATALNTSMDEEDFIIEDVQLSKSSRENSPDRICPTPVNFDDVSTPRLPDEVSEPDDEYRKRTYHTIHETESVVDDIVEICEDEELFVKKTDIDTITEQDDSIVNVTEKVQKFTNRIDNVKKPTDSTSIFKDTERRVHSDFIDENLKSDECLLSVSEKVNKFAKGPRDIKDKRSPARKITDEYDRNTTYTDDYTKLSVNDKAHLFIETAENTKVSKPKPVQKVERPDLSNVDESLKSDECLLSVSDKVNKFVKTAEQIITETTEVEEKERNIKEQQERSYKKIINDNQDDVEEIRSTVTTKTKSVTDYPQEPKLKAATPARVKDYSSPKAKPADRTPTVKITTLRSSEAVKKAKALFENIAMTQNKDVTVSTTKTTKLTDIGVIKKSPKTDSTIVFHPSVEDVSPNVTDGETDSRTQTPSKERPSSGTFSRPHIDDKPRSSPNRLIPQSPEVPRSKSPMRQSVEVTTTKTVLSRYPAGRAESPSYRPESPRQSEKPTDKIPGYLKPTKTSQLKEETKVVEETEVSSRRGSGKFGVELRRTSVERSTVSSERRRSVDHHQPCIEDIYDLDLLEQMLEKVVGYEQRRRIRSQIRIVKKETEHIDSTNTYTKTSKQTLHVQTSSTPKHRSPERHPAKSPERAPKTAISKHVSPDRSTKIAQRTVPDRNQAKAAPFMNGHAKEPAKISSVPRQRSPEKPAPKSTLSAKSPVRHPSPEKRRPVSPSKTAPKQKPNRFNEYASAYMKKVGLNETDKVKFTDTKTKTSKETKQTIKHEKHEVQEFSTTKSFTERTSSKDIIETIQINGKKSPSPEKRQSPERKHTTERSVQSPERKQTIERRVPSSEHKAKSPERKPQSPERLYQRTPSPDFKRPRNETGKETIMKTTSTDTGKETIIKTVHDIEKKIPKAQIQEEKPSWVTNRNLKKITSEARTLSSKKIEPEKPKYRPASPSKVITKPIDVITSSYGPGPLDSDGKPLFGIKALRNGGSNFQVKGTVIRQEFHSRNGGEPEGSVSVTAYSSQPEELEQLMASQGMEAPSRIHGISAVTTTKKFGGDTGHSISNVHTKEERASLDQFTHTDRKMDNRIEHTDYETKKETTDSRRVQSRTDKSRREEKVRSQKVEERREKVERKEDKKTVRQSSVKSLTEKFIKSANDTGKTDRSHYPKAGLILRTTTLRDSISSDDAPGVVRTDSEHSLVDEAFSERVETVRTTHTHGPTRTSTVTVQEPTVSRHTRTTVTVQEPTISRHSHTRTSTVTVQEPTITHGHTRTVTVQEPTVTRQTRTVIVQEPVTTVSHGETRTERSFLDSNTKVTGVQDILTRMKNADIVIQEGDTDEDTEARALLNKFLGATVLMAGMQGYVNEQPTGQVRIQETIRNSSGGGQSSVTSTRTVEEFDVDHCWDEHLLRKLLDECTDYEQRRRLRARIRTLMAEQEACANAVTEALGCVDVGGDGGESREEEEVTVSSSVRRDSSDKTVTSTTTKTSKVIESMTRPAPKPVSPFAKFRQLEKQNSTNSPNSPKTPQSPGSPSQPYFKFTDPALHTSALTIKERLLQWCRDKTRDYENVKLENFSTSWADGLAFCALVHHFLPDAFDYSQLTADKRRHNFTLAFKVADEKAGIYPLLDVDDMVAMRKPDWKCVFTYVQSIYRRFKDEN